jgi:hypothetical protein
MSLIPRSRLMRDSARSPNVAANATTSPSRTALTRPPSWKIPGPKSTNAVTNAACRASAVAVGEAHRLVKTVMRERGYPIDDFEQRAADISVDHPAVVEDYRVAYRVSKESAEGRATTEDLREAMVRYRSLFAGLLDVHDEASHETTERRPR